MTPSRPLLPTFLTGPWHRYGPGLATASLIAVAATFVHEHHGGPQFLYALLFGIALNFLASEARTRPGIDLAARGVLRLGVGLLGARITATQIAQLGWLPVLLVVVSVSTTIAFGAFLARRLGRPVSDGILSGGAVGICGASAALAIATLMPRSERGERFTLLTVVGVTALSTLAMIGYPVISRVLGLDNEAAGIFLGGTIHDVAQVVGAGYTVSPRTGDTATFVKLLRVSMLVPVMLGLSIRRRRDDAAGPRPPLLPWFLVLFTALVGLNSLDVAPRVAIEATNLVSRACLLVAVSALGVKTSFHELRQLGWQPVVLLVGETLFLGALVLGGVLLAPR